MRPNPESGFAPYFVTNGADGKTAYGKVSRASPAKKRRLVRTFRQRRRRGVVATTAEKLWDSWVSLVNATL